MRPLNYNRVRARIAFLMLNPLSWQDLINVYGHDGFLKLLTKRQRKRVRDVWRMERVIVVFEDEPLFPGNL